MKRAYLCLLVSGLTLNAIAQNNQINTTTELNKLCLIQDLPKYWKDTKVKQVSSYDTTGNNDDGFSGKYSFIRKNADSSLVIFEAKGNGVINRIWTPTPNNDMLDFYFGGSAKPNFSIRFSDLFSGKVFPFISPLTGNELGGYFCYFPISFKNGCKIVSRGKKMEFYQIQYRSYPKNYQIRNFSSELNEQEKLVLTTLGDDWNKVAKLNSKPIHTESILTPSKSVTIADINEGGRITGIKLHHADSFRGLNKNVLIKMSWDDEQPAIFMPVADFFGYAFGKESMQSLLLGSADNTNYCYFPMPFTKKAKIELLQLQGTPGTASTPINIEADVYVEDTKYEPSKEGKFYAFWNPDKNTKPETPHLFLEGKGKGHYVGTILQAQGLNPGMTLFFEGDDVTTIDGEMRMHGTGSEDYFNGGWYALLDRWDRKMSLPLHGSLDYSLPYARTGGYRLFISDKMPFEKEIKHTIEHGPEKNNKPGDYTSVAFYYADKSINSNLVLPTEELTKVYIPDTLMVYPQLMQYTIGGAVKIDGNILHATGGGQVKIDLSELPKGHYKLYADMEKSDDGAEITIWQRQKLVSEPISFYTEKRQSFPNSYLCDIDLDDFKNAITLHFKPDDKKSIVNIHRLILVHQKTNQ
ncbi:glycoside hydrolase family 172 protein [Pedobacter panaciterrae]|uniref:Glycoside hydrolase family 172 protein n=1 Tax=Pedobacter panaciterrae TaxID=363849 RepID=A0ABU8NSJ0_9SPHI